MGGNMRVHARNFKSLQDVSISLGGFNVLIGANGSGKTNVLELFKFMSLCTNPHRVPAYPFAPWWGFNNIAWSQNERLPVTLCIQYDLGGRDVEYSAVISGAGGGLEFKEEALHISGYLDISRRIGRVRYALDKKFQDAYKDDIEEAARNYGNKVLRDHATAQLSGSTSILDAVYNWAPFSEGLDIISLSFQKSDMSILSPQSDADDKISSFYMNAVTLFEKPFSELPGEGLLLLRNLDYDALHNPVQIDNSGLLQENGDGLINMLFGWSLKGGLPRRIERALEELFPGWSISFDQTADARILMKVNDGYNVLNPPSIPDGFYKALAILSAVEIGPRFLLIDELETSLHARIIEYLLDELVTCDATVIITTHSPTVIDLVNLEDLVLLDMDKGGTVCRRVEDPDGLIRVLSEKGITPSEQWMYDRL